MSKYLNLFKTYLQVKIPLEKYLDKIFKDLIKKTKDEISINFKKFKSLGQDTKISLINESIKQLKKNYYDLRSKKVDNLINSFEKKEFKKSTLGGCIFSKKMEIYV